jgi:hypothetical protein
MLQKRWSSKRDPAKRREILAFLATPAAQGIGDREIARRFLVHHQLVARLRSESTPTRVDDSKSKSPPYSDPVGVDDSRPRPAREDSSARSSRLADLETKFAREATEAWVESFNPIPESNPKPLSPELQRYRDELREILERTGAPADPPDFLRRRR